MKSVFGEQARINDSKLDEQSTSLSESPERNSERSQAAFSSQTDIGVPSQSQVEPLIRISSTISPSLQSLSPSAPLTSSSTLDTVDNSKSKFEYVRPKKDRPLCKNRDDHPEGFRGEHKLRRHQDRQHRKVVKKWVCITPVGSGHPTPDKPLSRCNDCTQQKKKYNAYYNAAAYLRHAHFRPKRGKTEKMKRGGKAAGDWPPMSELKHWMMEVEETTSESPLVDSLDDSMITAPGNNVTRCFTNNEYDPALNWMDPRELNDTFPSLEDDQMNFESRTDDFRSGWTPRSPNYE